MPEKTAFATFLVAALMLNLAPGPDMLYLIGRSLGQGRRAGVLSALGIFTGCLVHIVAAAVGIAALLRSSPVAFDVVRYAGAGYLIYLGVRMLANKPQLPADANLPLQPLHRIFYQGVITNILNPKVAMFFLAFLPQFVDPGRGSVAAQIVLLGMIFDIGGTLVNLCIALAAGALGDRLRGSRRTANMQRWLAGSVFLALGARLALARRA